MKTNLIRLSILFLSIVMTGAAQSPGSKGALDRMFGELEQNGRMMGTVTILKDGKLIYSRELGWRDVSGRLPNDAGTMFRIGSITKSYTAALIFRLIEEKKLTLETTLSKFFPEIPGSERITIAHMLSKTSGIPRMPPDVDWSDPKNWIFQPQTRGQMITRMASMQPVFAPGDRVMYSNSAYILLGFIVEAASGMPYAEYLEKNIVGKSGLRRTRFGGGIDPGKNDARSFYWDSGKWNRSSEENLSVGGGAGAMVASSADLAHFFHRLFATETILRRGSQKLMTSPFIESLPESTRGVAVGTIDIGSLKKQVYQIDGGIDGTMSLATYVPEDNLVISLIINGYNYPIGKLFYATIGVYYGQDVAVPSFKPIQLNDDALVKLEGSYVFKDIGMTIAIKNGKNGLTAQASGQDAFVIEPVSPSMFVNKESGIIIEFKTNADGAPVFDLYQQRNELRFVKEKP